jgi:hypothetical protein
MPEHLSFVFTDTVKKIKIYISQIGIPFEVCYLNITDLARALKFLKMKKKCGRYWKGIYKFIYYQFHSLIE